MLQKILEIYQKGEAAKIDWDRNPGVQMDINKQVDK